MSDYDLTGTWGFGGSSGLLDWGSDIARQWGLGLSTGLEASAALDDYRYRQMSNPLRLERELMEDQLKREQLQNTYTDAYYKNQAAYQDAVLRNPEYTDPYAEMHYGNHDPIRQQIYNQQQQQQPIIHRQQTAVTNGNNGSSRTNQSNTQSQQPSQTSYEYNALKGMIVPVYGNNGN